VRSKRNENGRLSDICAFHEVSTTNFTLILMVGVQDASKVGGYGAGLGDIT
jgi:hypothetical protein